MIPKVFVSYSHDTLEHKKWVLDLAIRMRNNGIDAIIDQWELKPGDDLPHFMETNLVSCDRVLMVCTENYVEKANSGIGGVGYEKMIVTSSLLKRINETKVIPIIRQISTKVVPTFLKTKLYIDFSNPRDFEYNFDELVRTIHDSPLYEKPKIGNNPFKQIKDSDIKKHDNLIELMKVISIEFDATTSNYVSYNRVKGRLGISRILFDVLLGQAVELYYIKYYSANDHDIVLLDAGKQYIINNNLY